MRDRPSAARILESVASAGRLSVVGLTALVAVACGGEAPPRHHLECGGTAVVILPPVESTAGDAAADSGAPADASEAAPKPACTGSCDEYLAAVRAGVQAETSAICEPQRQRLVCVPRSTSPDCPYDTSEEVRAIELEIRAYLAREWPELTGPRTLRTECACEIF
jgi:hypothetical protein